MELGLAVLQPGRGAMVRGLAITDRLVIGGGDVMIASATTERFATLGVVGVVHDVLAIGDTVWACGESGLLTASRDAGKTWRALDTSTRGTLRSLALAPDGALWVCGDSGYLARAHGGRPIAVDLATGEGLKKVYAVRDEIVTLGEDAIVRRWTEGGGVTTASPGAPIEALAVTARSWIAVGADGFIARSPDGAWYSRISLGGGESSATWHGIAVLRDGRLLAVGAKGRASVSVDDGRTWTAIVTRITDDLTCVRRFGAGAIAAGAGGVVVRIAPPHDIDWTMRVDSLAELPAAAVAEHVQHEPVAEVASVDEWADALDDIIAADDDAEPVLTRATTRAEAEEDHPALARVVRHPSDEVVPLLARVVTRDEDAAPTIGRAATRVELVREPDDADEGYGFDDDEPATDGVDAIERALDPVYHNAEPLAHHESAEDVAPLTAISAYARPDHFHFVTFGFTELFDKDSDDFHTSGYGFELSFRVARAPGERTPPTWPVAFLRRLARYVFDSGNTFAAGHKLALASPIAPELDAGRGRASAVVALAFADDPELGDIFSPNGEARFVLAVGITADEHAVAQDWSVDNLVEILAARSPMLATDLDRRSILDDPHVAVEVHRRVDREGSSESLAHAAELEAELDAEAVRIVASPEVARAMARALTTRLRHGRTYELRGPACSVVLEPSDVLGFRADEDDHRTVILEITPDVADEIETALRDPDLDPGRYRFASWPRLSLEIR